MVQELINELAELEARRIFLFDRHQQAVNEAKKTIDMINEIEGDIFNMRQEIELQISNN